MNIEELYQLMKEECLSQDLKGSIIYNGECIKWEFDVIGELFDLSQAYEYILDIADADKEMIDDFFNEYGITEFDITETEIDETIGYFYIEE